MAETERTIELVLRFKTNGYREELDELMAYGQQIQQDMSGTGDLYSEVVDSRGREDFWMEYLPEGSHWRDVTPVEGGWLVSFGVSTCLFIFGAPFSPFHPSAADLPGGNELSPPQGKP